MTPERARDLLNGMVDALLETADAQFAEHILRDMLNVTDEEMQELGLDI